MPSSPLHGCRGSSPEGGPGSPRSIFTYRHLTQLASYNNSCPLRVIAHIDLDCFYAQAEMVRLGIAADVPLAVQQWQGLIAINYPARAFGIGRHCTVTEAKKLCPQLICQHVATWREGDSRWAYRPDAAEHIATDKVSLDPYRLQSRRIMAVIKQHLPPHSQKVEKASIDEVFLDLSAHVHAVLLERFPELARPPAEVDPSEHLPMPSISALDWQADDLVDLDDEEAELTDPDWDDVAILIASEIVRHVRDAIRDKLGYTCSAGIARNKMLSKLGSAHKKPNQQTVIRNRAIRRFLSLTKLTKIRNLGGKLGEQVSQAFQTDAIDELIGVPIDQLKQKLGDETGVWLYNTLRGVDTSEVNSRTQIKSMLSAKSFRPSISTVEQATKWLAIFAADIFARLVEEGVLEHKRRPRTITLHHRQEGQTRSRQSPIPSGRPLNQDGLLNLAKSLLQQIVDEGNVWPCSNLSLSVGGFEDGVSGNMGIDAFLLKGEDIQPPKAEEGNKDPGESLQPAAKRPRTDGGGIRRFFTKQEALLSPGSRTSPSNHFVIGDGYETSGNPGTQVASGIAVDGSKRTLAPDDEAVGTREGYTQSEPITTYVCSRCDTDLACPEELQSHQDWHFAKDLQDEEVRGNPRFANRPSATGFGSHTGDQKNTPAGSKRPGRPKKTERGQSKLRFG